jgi:hypothetical protein
MVIVSTLTVLCKSLPTLRDAGRLT